MAASDAVIAIDLSSSQLKKIASGKVRELYEIDPVTLLFIATDRISAYDVVLSNGIPGKGVLLTQLSAFWFSLINQRIPTLRTHLITTDLPSTIPATSTALLTGRTMQVRSLGVIPLESIVRGYITGSAWAEYEKHGTVHGIPVPPGLQESQKLDKPLWTPSTKAEPGEHDENISPERAAQIVGVELAKKVEIASLQVYEMAHDYAFQRGIIIADTKFEFGLDTATGELVLVDEVLTPDSSRFWPAAAYEAGRGQQSYDKQYLRDWLTSSGFKGKEGTAMPEEVVADTAKRYHEAYEMLTGKSLR